MSKQLLKSTIRAKHESASNDLDTIQVISGSSVGKGTSEAQLDEIGIEVNALLKNVLLSLQAARVAGQKLSQLDETPQDHAHTKRLQDITQSLLVRQASVSKAFTSTLEDRRRALLLSPTRIPVDSRGGGVEEQSRLLLNREMSGLDMSINVLTNSITTAKASYNNLTQQAKGLTRVHRTARSIANQVVDIGGLITKIKKLKCKQQACLLVVFFLLTLSTLIYISKSH